MEIEALRWFQQVADGVTVTEVADVYMVSQPGVSRALSRLEAEVGTPLLHRSGRVLRPTHAGAVFKRHVDSLLHELDDGLAAVNELHDPETGTVRLAFQLSLGAWLVPELVASFRRAHPQVRFVLEQSQDALGSSLVAGGRTDLEFTARRPRNPEVEWQQLVSQRLDLAVPKGHRLAGRDEVALGEAATEDFVMLRSAWELRALTDALCADAGFTPRVAFEGDDLRVVSGFVAAGLGVAVMPAGDDISTRAREGHRMVPLSDEGAFRDVGVAWSKTRRLLPSADLFRRHVLRGHPRGR
jgi:LysR family transcriptional activator of glutamate synthase operon